MLGSIREFSSCGIRSQTWPMWIRNSSSFQVAKKTFPAKGNSKWGDEEHEVANLMLKYFKPGDEEPQLHAEDEQLLADRRSQSAESTEIVAEWREIVAKWTEIVEAGEELREAEDEEADADAQ